MSNGIIAAADTAAPRAEGWVHLDDWSPGVWDNTYIAVDGQIISAPLGAGNPDATFCCASLPGGGLGPLPARAAVFDFTPDFPGTTATLYVTGFICNPGLASGDEELVILLEGDDGTNHYVIAYSIIPQTSGSHFITGPTSTNPSTSDVFGSPYPAWTRISSQPVIGDPDYVIPTPVLVFPTSVVTDAHGGQGHLWCYPPVSAPTTFAAQDLIDPMTSGNTGPVICDDSRVIVPGPVTYSWPVSGGVATNENICFTDPPESQDFGMQNTILAAESPWGYGAWGSISVGELLLVKKYGGAVVVIGDIDAPSSVISLPGVESVGNFVGRAAPTNIGVVYCSENRGAWAWNGGNVAQKISLQLRDDFYDAFNGIIPSENFGFYVQKWQNWLLFSNNLLYDADTNAWWPLYPRNGMGNEMVIGQTFFWFSQARAGSQMYAAPLRLGNADDYGTDWYSRFDSLIPAPHWQWASLPIHLVPTADRTVDIRQVVLRVSSPDSTGGSVTVTIGSWTATTDDTIGLFPTTFRFNAGTGALGLSDIEVLITADNDAGSAPILHSLDIAYNIRAGVPTDN